MSDSRPWTPEDEDRLRTLVEANRSLGVVAKELKRTESAVAGRAYKLGLKFGKPKTNIAAWRSGPEGEGVEMTDAEIQAWIIDLIESNMDEEDRRLALEWLEIRAVAFEAMKQSGLIADDDLVAMGLKAKGK